MSSKFDAMSMNQFNTVNFSEIINDFHDLLIDFKNKKLRNPKIKKEAITRCEILATKYRLASENLKNNYYELAKNFDEVALNISNYKAKLMQRNQSVASLKKSWNELASSYEKTIQELKRRRVPNVNVEKLKHLTPINYARNLFHALNAIVAVTLYQYVLTKFQSVVILGTIFTLFLILEILRRTSPQLNDFMVDKLFGLISRPRERTKINGASYYALAAFLMTIFVPKFPLELGLIVLGFGDPVANIIGIKFGKTKILKQKSLEGTLGFVAISFILTLLFSLFVLSLPWSIGTIVLMCLVISIVGALVELFSFKLDDNFTILVATTLIANLWF